MCCGKGKKKCSCKKYCFAECNTITNAVINENGDLIITISDGTQYNAGNVNPPNGYKPVLFSTGIWDPVYASSCSTDPLITSSDQQMTGLSFTLLGSEIPKIGDYAVIDWLVGFGDSGTGSAFAIKMFINGVETQAYSNVDSDIESSRIRIRTTITRQKVAGDLNFQFVIDHSCYAANKGFLPYTPNNQVNGYTQEYGNDLVIIPTFRINNSNAELQIADYKITKYLQP